MPLSFSIDDTGYFLQPALAKERFANIQEKHQAGELVWAGIDFLRRACPREEAFAEKQDFSFQAGIRAEDSVLPAARNASFGRREDDVLPCLRPERVPEAESGSDRGRDRGR